MPNKDIRVVILHILFAAGLVFLFAGRAGSGTPRSIGDLWNLGHVALFILFIFILYTDWKGFEDRSLALQWVLAVSLGAALALSTEVIQTLVGRNFDYMDIFRDLSGCVIGMLILRKTGVTTRRAENFVRIGAIGMLLVITSIPLFLSLTDEYIAARQFPVLASFETPLEIDRWRADGNISISREFQYEGDSSLKAEFTTRRYSRVTMRHSLGRWEGYGSLRFSFFNPETAALKIICRIHDNEHHKHDNAYSDRFHRTYILENGWNTFEISMDDISGAPKTRKMNLNEIKAVSFFTVSLPEPRIVYLDDIILTNGKN